MATQKTKQIETILIVDAATGESIERELNIDELSQRKLDQETFVNLQTDKDTKAVARESALAKLADLGLTAEEIAAL